MNSLTNTLYNNHTKFSNEITFKTTHTNSLDQTRSMQLTNSNSTFNAAGLTINNITTTLNNSKNFIAIDI